MTRIVFYMMALPLLMGMDWSLPETRIKVRVLDQEGGVVTNALVCCGFDTAKEAGGVFYGCTDGNGEFSSVARRSYCVFYRVAKEGFYGWHEQIRVLDGAQVATKRGFKPQEYERTVVLKRIGASKSVRSPSRVHPLPYPPRGKWVGYDLGANDYCFPQGKGEHPDCLIRFNESRGTNEIVRKLEITFTNNPHAGFYLMKKDMCSELKSVRRADVDSNFLTSMRYGFRESPHGSRQDALERDQYIVFRTRTRTDKQGRLVSAHYGMIFGGDCNLYSNEGMKIGEVFFNATPNDATLEDEESARRSKESTRQMYERGSERGFHVPLPI